MSYVMIPVPEDRVEDVMRYVVELMAQPSVDDWDGDAVAELFESIDEPSRALLSTVASAALEGEQLAVSEAAARIELSSREVMGLLRELNDTAREESRPVLIARRSTPETLANGRTREARLLSMDADVARLIHAADRAHLLAEEHPLGPDHA